MKSDPNEDVMIPKQSTTALPDRLTQGIFFKNGLIYNFNLSCALSPYS